MKSLIKNLFKYITIRLYKIDFKDVDFRSETETIVTLKIRFFGYKKFIKNYKNGSDWYEYNSYILYGDVKEMKNRIKNLESYPGGKNYEYVLDLVLSAMIERPEVKFIYLENSRDKKIGEILK